MIEERNRQIIGRLAVCDQEGYIGLYNIKNNDIISFLFRKKCHDSKIHCILYLSKEKVLVSRGDNNLRFWTFQASNLQLIKEFENISSIVYNNSLLDINGNLIVGEKNGIRVIKLENRSFTYSYFYKNEEFGDVLSIKSLGRNNFICGRSIGFCSIFLLREKNIRKVNIFRNNNLSVYNNSNAIKYSRSFITPFDIQRVFRDNYLITDRNVKKISNSDYAVTDICVKEVSENEGYILISSVDKTLKVYKYNYILQN